MLVTLVTHFAFTVTPPPPPVYFGVNSMLSGSCGCMRVQSKRKDTVTPVVSYQSLPASGGRNMMSIEAMRIYGGWGSAGQRRQEFLLPVTCMSEKKRLMIFRLTLDQVIDLVLVPWRMWRSDGSGLVSIRTPWRSKLSVWEHSPLSQPQHRDFSCPAGGGVTLE